MYLKLCLIIVLAFFYYSSNAHDDYENDDDDQSVTKSTNPKKRDVTQGQSDVTKSKNPKKRDVIQGKKGRKKCDGEPTDKKRDESMESMASNDKRDVNQGEKSKHDASIDSTEQPTDDSNKKRDVNKGKKRKHDVSMDNSEPTDDNGEIILKRRKTSEVSLRRSARVQLQKNKQRKTLAQLKKQRSKEIAGGFVLDESDVTYRAPKDFYGDFGVPERNIQGKSTMHDNEDEVQEAGSSGSSTEKVVIKKPKTGFINNELFPADDEEISDTTLNNNISVALAQIEEEDIEVNQLVDCDVRDCDVTNHDVTTPDKMNLFNHDRKVLFHTDDDEYRVDTTPGIIDKRWRIKCNSYPVDNRGFGQHREVLDKMEGGDTRDKNLIQILHDVINPEENEDDGDYDDDVDDYDDDDNGEETSDGNGTNGDVKGSSGSSTSCSDTSSYTNGTDKMPKDDTASATSPYDLSLSLSIEDGDKPQEKLNIDYQTRKRDVNGGKMKV